MLGVCVCPSFREFIPEVYSYGKTLTTQPEPPLVLPFCSWNFLWAINQLPNKDPKTYY